MVDKRDIQPFVAYKFPVYHPEEHALIREARVANKWIREAFGPEARKVGRPDGNGFGYPARFDRND